MFRSLFYTFIISLFVITRAQAQMPQGAMPAGKAPAIGRVYGKILDAGNKQPVEFAAVTILAMQKDSVINGALVKSNGDFSVDKLPPGRFRLRVQFVGYKTYTQPIMISMANAEQDLGNIKLEADATVLKDVTVEADRGAVSMTIDRKVYNVERDLSTKGGTAVDVMKNVPGVTVDADGSVALRNNAPTIFVDGRPTPLSLDQIPADQIERVEVITNPSARYDAGTTGGILNIQLKKNNKPGYNGTLSAGIGTNNRYNLGGNLNIKEKKLNVSLSGNLNTRGNDNKGYTNRSNLLNDAVTSSFKQNNLNNVNNLFAMARLGFDYALNNRNTITLAQSLNKGRFDIEDLQSFSTYDAFNAELSKGSRINEQKNGWENHTSQLLFRHTFPKKGKEWTTDVNYNRTVRSNNSDFTTYNFQSNGIPLPNNPELQKNRGSGKSDMLTFQFDFVNPLTDSSKLEWGLRSNYKKDNSILDVAYFDYPLGYYSPDSSLSNNYRITDIVNAAYINYSSFLPWGIAYQAGLRFEQTYFTAEIPEKKLSFDYIYPKGTENIGKALFPAIYLSKKFKQNSEMQLNFSRKINRPNYMQIMPFIMFSDKQSYRIGNPAMSPEFINLAELNYNYVFKTGNLLSSVYSRQTENAITNYVYALPTDSSILVSTFINGKNSWSYGWENSFKVTFFKKLDFTLNANIFFTDISANSATGALSNSGYSWNAKAIFNYRLPKSLTLQLNGSYEAPRIIPQGKTMEVYFVDFSVSKTMFKNLTVNVTVSDMFNTKRWGALYEGSNFTQDFSRRWDVRFVRLNLSWRFGDSDGSLFRKRSTQRREPGQGSMEMEY